MSLNDVLTLDELAKEEGLSIGDYVNGYILSDWFNANNNFSSNGIVRNQNHIVGIFQINKDNIPVFTVNDSYASFNIVGFKSFKDSIKEKESVKYAEKLANNIGYCVNDRCWNKNKEYCGKIKSFYINSNDELCCYTDKGNIGWVLSKISNSVVIDLATEEEFKFILKREESKCVKSFYAENIKNYLDANTGHLMTDYGLTILFEPNDVMILTVDEYMKSIGESRVFLSDDGKNIYDKQEYILLNDDCNLILRDCDKDGYNYPLYKKFSSMKAATEYLENSSTVVKLGKYTVDFKKTHDCITFGKYFISFDIWLDWYKKWERCINNWGCFEMSDQKYADGFSSYLSKNFFTVSYMDTAKIIIQHMSTKDEIIATFKQIEKITQIIKHIKAK